MTLEEFVTDAFRLVTEENAEKMYLGGETQLLMIEDVTNERLHDIKSVVMLNRHVIKIII